MTATSVTLSSPLMPALSAPPAKAARHIPALTSLRFFAAAMVAVYHMNAYFPGAPPWCRALPLEQGVTIFFVLSGFILTYVYEGLRPAGVGKFWRARFARIWPAHIAALLVLLLVIAPSAKALIRARPLGVLVANVALVHAWIPNLKYCVSYNSVAWSVSTEMGFYALFPLLILGLRRNWWIKLLSALVVVVGTLIWLNLALARPGADPVRVLLWPVCLSPLTRALEFVAGMSLAAGYRWLAPRYRAGMGLGTALEAGALALLAAEIAAAPWLLEWLLPYVGLAGKWYLGLAGLAILPAGLLILVLALGRGALSRALGWAPLVWLGEVSYSVYLVHELLLEYYRPRAQALAGVPVPVVILVYIALVILLAGTIWFFIERPLRAVLTGKWSWRAWWSGQGRLAPPMPRPVWLAAWGQFAALVILGTMAWAAMNKPLIAQVTPAQAASAAQGATARDIVFRQGPAERFVLRSVRYDPATRQLDMVWEARGPQRLDLWVGVHLLGENRQVPIGQADFAQDADAHRVAGGTLWRNTVRLDESLAPKMREIGLALYRGSTLLRIDSTPEGDVTFDLDRHRLLVPVRPAAATASRATAPAGQR